MKKITLVYHKHFPWTPISGWVGARAIGYIVPTASTGQFRKPKRIEHPFVKQRNKWCRMIVEFNGVWVQFTIPAELDHFLDIMSQKILPSGYRLIKVDNYIGRPNAHWLSRLPAKAKPWKHRQALCSYLTNHKTVQEFRVFYQNSPVKTDFRDEGIYDYSEAYTISKRSIAKNETLPKE